jgi:uncharacterized protein
VSGLPDPLGLLRDAAEGAERLGRSLIGRDRIRLAVTGLSRAGKTVFLTSLVANLLAAGQRGEQRRRTLPALERILGGRLEDVRVVPADAEELPRFDATRHLESLAADPPRWPDRTTDLSTLALSLTVRRMTLGGLLPPRQVTLELLDYPGEWLLDLPMLGQDFSVWSAETLARLAAGKRAEAARSFLDFVHALPANAPAEEALARRGHQLYRTALLACRDRLGFRFLQPGRLLHQGPSGDAPILWFFPLPAGARGGLAELLARRHAAYLAERRASFFEPFFRRFDRQVVLVDVLGALHAGEEAYEDTREALSAVANALRYGGGWLDWLTGAGVVKVAFAATKADHVPERQREALESQLSALVDAPKLRAAAAGAATAVQAIAAIRCTEDDVATLDGRTVAVVRGVRLEDGRIAKVFPGEVPAGPPKPSFWAHPFFAMPEFQPPRLTAGGASGMPHIGLDELVAWLIGDLL